MVARVLDLLFVLALGLIPVSIAIVAFPESFEPALAGGAAIAAPYLLLAEALGRGASPGKRLAGIRAVDAHTGKHCSTVRAVLRNMTLVIGPLDWIWIFGHRRHRLGDLIAGTDVIEE
jgi:uncharacterized RDD family membrane protein YckC